MKIYKLQTYEYDTYSYSGLSPNEEYYFLTKEAAIEKANDLDLWVKEYSTKDKECTIEEIELVGEE